MKKEGGELEGGGGLMLEGVEVGGEDDRLAFWMRGW